MVELVYEILFLGKCKNKQDEKRQNYQPISLYKNQRNKVNDIYIYNYFLFIYIHFFKANFNSTGIACCLTGIRLYNG